MNEILQKLHLINENVAWIAQPNTALWIQILAMIWQGIPFFYNYDSRGYAVGSSGTL